MVREMASGAKTDRTQLRRLLDQFDGGDVVMVTRLDQAARSTRDGFCEAAGRLAHVSRFDQSRIVEDLVRWSGYTVGCQAPSTKKASLSPGHGGIVAPIASRGSIARRSGIENACRSVSSTTRRGRARRFLPDRRACATCASFPRRCTRLPRPCDGDGFRHGVRRQRKDREAPRDNWHSTRTSEPSGAIASGALGIRFVSNPIGSPVASATDAEHLRRAACTAVLRASRRAFRRSSA